MEEEKCGGFIGALAVVVCRACRHSMKTRERGEVGGGAVVALVSTGVVVTVGTRGHVSSERWLLSS